MAYWKFNLDEHNANNSGIRGATAANSLVVEMGSPLHSVSTGVRLAAAGETLVGISLTNKTFDSDNFTVAMEKVLFNPEPNMNNLYELNITGGTVTLADEGVSMYDIVVDGADVNGFAVNGASESSTEGTLLLVEYISATKGIFRVVNL